MKHCTHKELLVRLYGRLGERNTPIYYRDAEKAIRDTEEMREQIRLHFNWPEDAE